MKLADVLLRGTRASQPAATAVANGTLYFVTDESVTEQSNGSAWVDYTDAGAGGGIAETLIDAKGDLIAGSAADTAARVAVGTNSSFLRANSGASAGIEWQLNNFSAATAPTVNEDSGDGYSVGSLWLDTTNDIGYVCLDATLGAAVWDKITDYVSGGAGSTDHAVARWDGATGKLVQDSDVILTDADVMTFPAGGAVLLDDSITAAGAALPLAFDGDADTGIFRPAANKVAFATAATEAMRINDSQVISFGTTVEAITTSNSTVPKFIFSANGTAAVMQWVRHTSPGGGGPLLQFSSTRGADANTHTVVQSGDGLGTLNFMGSDGTDYTPAAQISGAVDGTPGNNDMPGRLVFATTADGAATPTERMRIANGGNIYCTGAGTTASAANAFLNSGSTPANELLRSTSSVRYKTQIEPIEKPFYEKVLQLQPIWYRSLARADNPNWSYYGLGAEDVAKIDPRLVQWGYAEEDRIPELQPDGGITYKLKEGAQLIPDGVSYERIAVLLIPIIKEMKQEIMALKAELAALRGR